MSISRTDVVGVPLHLSRKRTVGGNYTWLYFLCLFCVVADFVWLVNVVLGLVFPYQAKRLAWECL